MLQEVYQQEDEHQLGVDEHTSFIHQRDPVPIPVVRYSYVRFAGAHLLHEYPEVFLHRLRSVSPEKGIPVTSDGDYLSLCSPQNLSEKSRRGAEHGIVNHPQGFLPEKLSLYPLPRLVHVRGSEIHPSHIVFPRYLRRLRGYPAFHLPDKLRRCRSAEALLYLVPVVAGRVVGGGYHHTTVEVKIPHAEGDHRCCAG